MGEAKFPTSVKNGSGDREAVRLRQEIADIRNQLGREIAELDRRRTIAVTKAGKYATLLGFAGLGAGALISTAVMVVGAIMSARRKDVT